MKNILLVNGYGYTDYQGEEERAMLAESDSCKGRLTDTLLSLGTNILKSHYHLKQTSVDRPLNVIKEQQLLRWADLVIWHFPVYWYNVPAATKNYLDLVIEVSVFLDQKRNDPPEIEYGYAGLLTTTKYMFIYTLAAPESSFARDGFFKGKTVDDLFLGTHKTMEYCGMSALESLALYDVMNPDRFSHLINLYQEHLTMHLLR